MEGPQQFVDSFIEDFGEGLTDIIIANIIHDQGQFESKFDFDLKPHGNEKEKHYQIDIYFFIPKNMGINSETYPREKFYANLNNYLRIQTPDLFKWQKNTLEKWNLPLADKYFSVHLITEKREKLAGVVVQEVKIFGCFVDTQLKNLQSIVMRLILRNKEILSFRPNIIEAITKRIQDIKNILELYRSKYLHPIREGSILMDMDVKRAFLLVDEYVSYRLESVLITLSQSLESNEIESESIKQLIHSVLSQECEYRSHINIVNLNVASDEKTRETSNEKVRETYYYRLGLLKKYVLEVLYLQNKNIKKEKSYRNLIAAIGAGLAAFWAGLSDIPRMQWAMMNTSDRWFRLCIFIILGVIAYIFKDRIKELTKEYFNQKLKDHLSDFDIHMFYKHFDEQNEEKTKFLGSCKEYMRYITKNVVPAEIAYIRDIGNLSEWEPARDEVILHYFKKLVFSIDDAHKGLADIHYIRDIARFDISEFLAKLDNPNKTVSYFDKDKGIIVMDAPRVYHINVVFRYSCSYPKSKKKYQSHIEFERIRIILNKKGILRVEEVLRRGELNYSEG